MTRKVLLQPALAGHMYRLRIARDRELTSSAAFRYRSAYRLYTFSPRRASRRSRSCFRHDSHAVARLLSFISARHEQRSHAAPRANDLFDADHHRHILDITSLSLLYIFSYASLIVVAILIRLEHAIRLRKMKLAIQYA